MKKVIGWLMLVAFFGAIVFFEGRSIGYLQALGVLCLALLLSAFIVLAVYLIGK